MEKSQFDLNLLNVIVAVANTKSVTRAASELRMSQPGLSTALVRIRRSFGDPIFVRTGSGMEPTARGALVIAEARDVLNRVNQRILTAPDFSPAGTETEFRFAMTEIAQTQFLPRILQALEQLAPQSTIYAGVYNHAELESMLESGKFDIAMGYLPDLGGSNIFQQQLFMHGPCCVLREGHPAAANLTQEEFCRLNHVVVQTPIHSQEVLERYFAHHRIVRRIKMRTTHFMTLPPILAASDMIATVPHGLGVEFATTGKIVAVPHPFPIPRYSVCQFWHRRVDKDPRIIWLRSLINKLFGPGSGFRDALD